MNLNHTPYTIQFAQRTDKGRVRAHNEDAVMVYPSANIAVVADGIGGANAGEIASNMLVTSLGGDLVKTMYLARSKQGREAVDYVEQLLLKHIDSANRIIFDSSRINAGRQGMGTTLVSAVFVNTSVLVAHIGDSRLYRWRSGHLEQITRDHTMLQAMIDSGVSTKMRKDGVLLRAVGVAPTVEAEFAEYATEINDIYLLCSDGLSDMLSSDDIAAVMREQAFSNVELAATTLVDLANEHGGVDNITVVLVRLDGQ